MRTPAQRKGLHTDMGKHYAMLKQALEHPTLSSDEKLSRVKDHLLPVMHILLELSDETTKWLDEDSAVAFGLVNHEIVNLNNRLSRIEESTGQTR